MVFLWSVLTADRLLVMRDGEIAELNAPEVLLSDSNSLVSTMVDTLGERVAKSLRQIATDAAVARIAQ